MSINADDENPNDADQRTLLIHQNPSYNQEQADENLREGTDEDTHQKEEKVDLEQDQNFHFYKEYCRLYYAKVVLGNRLQQLLNEKQDLN